MADYIYLLQNRLSTEQQNALSIIREIAREKGLTVFLVGGAVRDLTSGSPVRDLDVVVQGNALKLKKDIEKAGGVLSGELESGQALFVQFPGGARVEVGSTLSVTYPKPGKPVYKPATILDDLRRRDFTANAMALSLNDGSFGLLMDPLNGVADIENRELRLVSNYGFIEDPIRMVRAARLMARLGWQMDEKTQSRYETGKQEGYISTASAFQRGYEAEEIVHEEDALRVLKRLESEGWMQAIAPAWTSAKVNVTELEKVREAQTQLQMQGIHPSAAAVNFPLLTAKLTPKEVAELKASFPRQGFVREIEALDAEAKQFATQFSSKTAALPSQAWKMLYAARPEVVLQMAYSSKSTAIQAKLRSFYTEWPQARQKVPHALLVEMRIVPELPGYDAFLDSLVFELMDGKLGTVEEMKAFLEPFSPPAPPPPVHMRKARAPKKDAKAKGRAKKAVAAVDEDELAEREDRDDLDAVASDLDADQEDDDEGINKSSIADEEEEDDTDDDSSEATPAPKPAKAVAPKPIALKQAPVKPTPVEKPAAVSAPVAVKKAIAPVKPAAKATEAAKKPAATAKKPSAKPVSEPVGKTTLKVAAAKKPAPKPAVKVSTKKTAAKTAPPKKLAPTKTVAKKPLPNSAKKVVVKKAAKSAPKPVAKKTAAKKPVPKPVAAKKPAPTAKSKPPVKAAAKKRR
jgi:tRNA nucleotidyltransferase/poly(A) polymerase